MIIIYNTHIIGLSTSYTNIWSEELGADSHINSFGVLEKTLVQMQTKHTQPKK